MDLGDVLRKTRMTFSTIKNNVGVVNVRFETVTTKGGHRW